MYTRFHRIFFQDVQLNASIAVKTYGFQGLRLAMVTLRWIINILAIGLGVM